MKLNLVPRDELKRKKKSDRRRKKYEKNEKDKKNFIGEKLKKEVGLNEQSHIF